MTKRKPVEVPEMSSTLDATNYRLWASKVIAKYNQKGMMIDAMLWSQIIGYYERALEADGSGPMSGSGA